MRSLSRFLSSYIISQTLLDRLSSGHFVSFFSSFSSGSVIPESISYRRSMLRPPSIVAPPKLRYNVCSFIGTVVSRVQNSGKCSRGLRAFAFLKVKSDPRLQISSYFRQVFVQDLNYITRVDRNCTTSMPAEPDSGKLLSSPSGARREEMSVKIPEKQFLERLHLWQLFFASPSDWWDNRRSKKNPNSPDFKHKDTKECLWLSPSDPYWVREQLKLYDANMGGGFKRDSNNLLASCKWEFKD